MESKIIEKKQNPFFAREEIKLVATFAKNPSFDEAAGLVASETKSNKENILVREIKGKFGRNTFLVKSEVYKKKEDRDKESAKLEARKNKSGAKK